jgi:hypothetical protein
MTIYVRVNLLQAASPVQYIWSDEINSVREARASDDWHPTPFQTASCRHSFANLRRLLRRYLEDQAGFRHATAGERIVLV